MPGDLLKVEVFDDSRKVEVDDFEGLIGIDLPHHEIHEGNYFSATSVAATAIADNAKISFYISVPSDKKAHAVFIAACGGDALFFLLSGCTVSAKGTTVSSYNWNRSSSRTSGVSVWNTPTVGLSGTTFFQTYLPGGAKASAVGGSINGRQEIILAPSTKYLMMLQNKAGGAKMASLGLDWYEESV